MTLISNEDLGQVARVRFAGKSFDSVLRLASRFFQGFKYTYVVYVLGFFTLFGLFVFDLLNRGVFRTLSNIQDGTF